MRICVLMRNRLIVWDSLSGRVIMNRLHTSALLLSVFLPAGLTAQSPPPAPVAKPLAFVAADIHPSPLSFFGNGFRPSPFTGDRFVVHQATPLNLITTAYRVEADAVTGGPPGLEFDHYDIVASTPPGTTEKDTAALLQTLLANRFKLVAESQMEPLPAFLLKAGSGAAKMKPAADASGDSGCRVAEPPPPPGTPFPTTITLKCTNMTMEQFGEQLQGFGAQSLNHPVVDATGMKGAWDFDFRFTWQPGAPDAITIFEAANRLGLKLEAGTAPRPAIAIVSMAEVPTANAAGIEKLLPPPPLPSFEVAVIRPSKNESKEAELYFHSANQVTLSGSERRLISLAWDISEKTIFDAPPFSDEKVWEITAKLPVPDTPLEPGRRPQIDFDQVRLMLQALLAERFSLKVFGDLGAIGEWLAISGNALLVRSDHHGIRQDESDHVLGVGEARTDSLPVLISPEVGECDTAWDLEGVLVLFGLR
jgi:uncharacterized protein (TIGR03435 family)